jgi:hypothetical protein
MSDERIILHASFATAEQKLRAKSAALLFSLEASLPRLMAGWFVVAILASALRIFLSPLRAAPALDTLLPYLLLVNGPLVSMGLALHWFRDGHLQPQPATRLACVGRWQNVSRIEAERHPLYGAGGIMVSLLVGMLLNVPVRALEYLAAIPALSGSVPAWLATLHLMMTLDVVILTSLYTIAFVAALRRVPLFPRLLVAIWAVDLAMQLGIASVVAGTEGLPPKVAEALRNLLDGNAKKVLISIGLWLPYLLMSRRVNVTYRHRVERA